MALLLGGLPYVSRAQKERIPSDLTATIAPKGGRLGTRSPATFASATTSANEEGRQPDANGLTAERSETR